MDEDNQRDPSGFKSSAGGGRVVFDRFKLLSVPVTGIQKPPLRHHVVCGVNPHLCPTEHTRQLNKTNSEASDQ